MKRKNRNKYVEIWVVLHLYVSDDCLSFGCYIYNVSVAVLSGLLLLSATSKEFQNSLKITGYDKKYTWRKPESKAIEMLWI